LSAGGAEWHLVQASPVFFAMVGFAIDGPEAIMIIAPAINIAVTTLVAFTSCIVVSPDFRR
jgi:hypothetical protein